MSRSDPDLKRGLWRATEGYVWKVVLGCSESLPGLSRRINNQLVICKLEWVVGGSKDVELGSKHPCSRLPCLGAIPNLVLRKLELVTKVAWKCKPG